MQLLHRTAIKLRLGWSGTPKGLHSESRSATLNGRFLYDFHPYATPTLVLQLLPVAAVTPRAACCHSTAAPVANSILQLTSTIVLHHGVNATWCISLKAADVAVSCVIRESNGHSFDDRRGAVRESRGPLPAAAFAANHGIQCDFPTQILPCRLSPAKFKPAY